MSDGEPLPRILNAWVKLRWEWRPQWGHDPWDGWYQHGWHKVLLYSTDGGHSWELAEEPPMLPNEKEQRELWARFPHP